MEYEELLNQAIEKMPKKTGGSGRFKIPNVIVEIQGNKTLIKNFSEISTSLRRDQNHLAKFFFKEFATFGNVQSNILTLQTKVREEEVQRRFENYIKEFVYCKVCREPDTKLEKEERIF